MLLNVETFTAVVITCDLCHVLCLLYSMEVDMLISVVNVASITRYCMILCFADECDAGGKLIGAFLETGAG